MAKKEKSARVRNFCGVCYDEQIKDLRSYLIDYENRGVIRAYYIIMHEPEEEEKQTHFHFLIEYYDAKTVSAVTKAIGVRDGIVQTCTDLRSYACYLIHKFEVDKKRYYPSQVSTNDSERYRFLIDSHNSNEVSSDKQLYNQFCDLLYGCEGNINFDTLINILCKDKNVSIRSVRKNIYLFKNIYLSYKHLECFSKDYDKEV